MPPHRPISAAFDLLGLPFVACMALGRGRWLREASSVSLTSHRGSAIPGAAVVIRNVDTNQDRQTNMNGAGKAGRS